MDGSQKHADSVTRGAFAQLRWRIRKTRWALVIECAMAAFWPLIALVLIGLATLRLNGLVGLGRPLAISVMMVFGILWLIFFIRGIREFHWPGLQEARDRIDSALPGRPLQALGDTQAIGGADAGARYLWALHIERMAAAAEKARTAVPRIRLSVRDPWAFRLIAVFVFAGALLFGRSDPVQSLVDSLHPPAPVLATGPGWEGWAEPPTYTGKPSVYLNDVAGSTINLPEDTIITLRVYGRAKGTVRTGTVTAGGDTAITPDETGLGEISFGIRKSGDVVLTLPTGDDVNFRVNMITDQAPAVQLTGEIVRTVQGTFRMSYNATDDYGVRTGTARITLSLPDVERHHGLVPEPEAREPIMLDMPIPFIGDTSDFEETVIEDLSRHPWAGLPVIITFTVTDDPGQEGIFSTGPTLMPRKRFFDTTAGAIAEMRRDLLWSRKNAIRTTQILKAITWEPETNWQGRPEKAYLMVRTALRRLQYNAGNLTPELRDEVAELLWQAAVLIENGDLGDARERLHRAQQRLSEAMRNGATQEEIRQLMDALRQATSDYVRQLADQQHLDREKNRQAQAGRQMTGDQLQEMMDRIQELMEQGRMEEAQELMRQFRQMMENLQVTEEGQGQNNQAMEGLGDTLREQQNLADETFRELQEKFRRDHERGQNRHGQEHQSPQTGQNRHGQGRQNEHGPGVPGRTLAERQRALRDMLTEQRWRLEADGIDGGAQFGDRLDEAERQMGRAEDALRERDESEALDRQADAMEALREGMRQLNEARRNARNRPGGPHGQQSGGADRQQRDPLGRPLSRNGVPDTDERLVPGDETHRRAHEVMDEIRRRSGDRTRPRIELDYLKRLLDRL
ncbi:MAG: TIGR02302 family protein [Rhodobacteraceae bacterium]|nr:TIGR02302 family protein [Paracoccaceae bacterium]